MGEIINVYTLLTYVWATKFKYSEMFYKPSGRREVPPAPPPVLVSILPVNRAVFNFPRRYVRLLKATLGYNTRYSQIVNNILNAVL